MVPEFMDQEYLRARGVDFDDPKFEEEYRDARAVFNKRGRLPESLLLILAMNQRKRKAKGEQMRGAKKQAAEV